MFGAASQSPQRDEYLTFTRPHIELPGVIIVRNDVDGELQRGDLQHRRVAVVSGYVWQDLGPEITFDVAAVVALLGAFVAWRWIDRAHDY